MGDNFTRRGICATGAVAALTATALPGFSQQQPFDSVATQPYDTSNGEWRTYGGNLGSWRYSPLDQINADNFSTLRPAWTFRTESLSPEPDFKLESTPLMIKGLLYTTVGLHRMVVAINARNGELIWKYSLDEGVRGENAPRQGSGFGLSYWTDGIQDHIIFVTPGYQMVCLDAKSGFPVSTFGTNGIVDLKKNDDQEIDLSGERIGDDIGLHATPLVIGDVIVVGAAHFPSPSPRKRHVKGYVRGFDIHTGNRLWIFHTVPQKGELGYDSWFNNSADYSGNAGSWCQNSADPELGLVYIGVELPTGDWYGGTRPGPGLFGESIVALDVKTGLRRWHYQTVHHGFQDRDIPCASILADITVNGRKIKALAQPSKQAYLYVLDRRTGIPVWSIPERPVPQGDVPGEWYPPTQPMPSKPPAFDEQGTTVDRLIDFTPELRAEAIKLTSHYQLGPLFTGAVLSKWPRPLATIMSPNSDGAAQWPGGSFDPETNILYIFSNMSYGAHGEVAADPKVTDAEVMAGQAQDPNIPSGARRHFNRLTVQGMPLFKPPYGRITAIDLNKGGFVWQIPHGETPDEVRNNPAVKGLNIPRTGSTGKVGTLVTKTLVIAGEGTITTGPDGSPGAMLRAYNKATGKEVGAVRMPTRVTGSPMTYMVDGAQYIAIPISSPGFPAQLISYKLPG